MAAFACTRAVKQDMAYCALLGGHVTAGVETPGVRNREEPNKILPPSARPGQGADPGPFWRQETWTSLSFTSRDTSAPRYRVNPVPLFHEECKPRKPQSNRTTHFREIKLCREIKTELPHRHSLFVCDSRRLQRQEEATQHLAPGSAPKILTTGLEWEVRGDRSHHKSCPSDTLVSQPSASHPPRNRGETSEPGCLD